MHQILGSRLLCFFITQFLLGANFVLIPYLLQKSSVVLGSCYFVVLSYIAISNPQLEKLCLLPFFGVAVAAPLYAAALLKECDR